MKSTTLPPVRVEPEFRAAAESVLHEGESLTGFIDATVRRAVEYRRVQAEFHSRGQAAWEEIQRGGITHSADDVLAHLAEEMRNLASMADGERHREAALRKVLV